MTKVNLGIIVLTIAGLIAGCGKRKPNVAPEPDTEVNSALDATWMTYVVTDIDMMCSFLAVNQPYQHFYQPIPDSIKGQFNGNIDYTLDITDRRYSMNFYDCWSLDGRFRRGEVRIRFNPNLQVNPRHNPNAIYYHRYGWGGQLTLTDYRVNREDTVKNLTWLLTMPAPGTITQEIVDSASFNPATDKLKWKISAKFNFKHPTDQTGKQDMYWEGTIFKVLENTNDEDVYNPALTPAVNWSLASVGYYGDVTGTIGGKKFSYSVKESQKLIRDFTCAPDRVGGVKIDPTDNIEQRDETHHPFVKGIASFTIASNYPRQIYYGNESNTKLAWQCDNVGEVMIKGIAYRVNFHK